MNTLTILLVVGCGCMCLSGILIILLLVLYQVGKHETQVKGNPAQTVRKKAPHAPPMPTSAPRYIPSAKGIHFPGGAREWEHLLRKINLQTGETAETLAEKGEVMVNFINTLDRAVLLPLWALAAGSKHVINEHKAAADHPAQHWAVECQQALDEWGTKFPEIRSGCLENGQDNSAALTCIVEGVVSWLARAESLRASSAALLSQLEEPAFTDDLRHLLPRIDDLAHIRSDLEKRDISWMSNIPRNTFGNPDLLQKMFAERFGPFDREKAVLPIRNILERRPGRINLASDQHIDFGFGVENGEEYLQFRITRLNNRKYPGIVTHYRMYPSGRQEKFAPWICENCGESLDGPYQQCGECSADELVYLAWGKKSGN